MSVEYWIKEIETNAKTNNKSHFAKYNIPIDVDTIEKEEKNEKGAVKQGSTELRFMNTRINNKY